MTAPIYETILGAIGNTPLVPVAKLTAHRPAKVWAKCEFLNPTGSHKDRIGIAMLEWAEEQGLCKPGDTLVEPTSGNTGLGVCLAAAVKGYRLVLTMPEKVSAEKQNLMRAYGAEVITAPDVPHEDPRGYMFVAERLVQERGYVMLNQYANPGNPQAHFETAREIWEQTGGTITHFVAGAGTGGLITGAGKWLKERKGDIQLIGIDPEGSIYSGDEPGTYTVEGIGYDFWPPVFEPEILDRFYRISDAESWYWARRLAREEGLLVGGSTGTVFGGVIRLIDDLDADAVVVMIAHDTGRNYLSKTDLSFLRERDCYLPIPGEEGGVDLCQATARAGLGHLAEPPFREVPVAATMEQG
ncbi:MAG TPA: cysteine synthase family protein [bacterium]|nr:cysteine synthase family protein [bacterium]